MNPMNPRKTTVMRTVHLIRWLSTTAALACTVNLTLLGIAAAQASEAPQKLRIVGGLANVSQFTQFEEPFWKKTFPSITQGKATAEIVPFNRAGVRATEVLRLMQMGVLPFGTATLGGILSTDPELAAMDMAGMNPDMASLKRSVAAFRPHLERVMRERHGIEVLAIYAYPAQVTFCSRPFTGLADLAGRRVRFGNPTQADLIRPFGAVPVQLEFAEVVPNMRNGNIDCAITGAMSGHTIGLHKVATHIHGGATNWGLSVFGANTGAWQALAPAVRAALGTELPKLEKAIWADAEQQTLAGMACVTGNGPCSSGEPGQLKDVPATPTDSKRLSESFRTSVLPVWVQRCGNACVPVWNQLLAPATGIKAETTTPLPKR